VNGRRSTLWLVVPFLVAVAAGIWAGAALFGFLAA
jgi:hypothetical protein